jgi:flagellar hook-basal body complex protein FliE
MVDKINPFAATNAYSNTSRIAGKAGSGDEGEGEGSTGGVSFSDFLREKAAESIDTFRHGEKMSAQAVTGEANITDVVQAVNAADLTLQTVVAVRDRLIGAYQEIMRMPI